MNISKPRQTILVIILGMVLLFVAYKWKGFLLIAGLLLIVGIASPIISQKIHLVWTKFGQAMGFVNNRILLAIIFFIVLTPMAIIKRMLGGTSMNSKPTSTESTFTHRNHEYLKKDFEDLW